MKKIIKAAGWIRSRAIINLLFLLLIFIIPGAGSQPELNSSQWEADLDHLQQKIHREYSFLFHNISGAQFDSAVTKLKEKIPELTGNEIKMEFFRLIAMFRIGHTGIRFKYGEDPNNLKPMFSYYPLTVYPFADGLYIKSIDTAYREALGGKIIKIDAVATNKALEKLHEVIPSENEQYFRSNLASFFCLPELLNALKITASSSAATLTYIKEGKIATIRLAATAYPQRSWNAEPYLSAGWLDAYSGFGRPSSVLWLKHPGKPRFFEYNKESKALYVRHSTVEDGPDETIAEFFKKVFAFAERNEVKKFVLDIRLNAGGNNYLNKPVITGIIQSKKINRYGHLFVITGPATFSAAQNLTNELEKYTEAIFVGEPTGENVNFWADVQTEVLPNSKLNVVLSSLWWQNMDPRDKRQWTAPGLATEMSYADYSSGNDKAMNAILQFKEQRRIEDRVMDLIVAGDTKMATAVMKAYMDDPLHRFCKNELEGKINERAYALLGKNELKMANAAFYLNVVFFPQSANAYDSYAESLYKLGRIDQAIRNYEVVIHISQDGGLVRNAMKMIGEIKKNK